MTHSLFRITTLACGTGVLALSGCVPEPGEGSGGATPASPTFAAQAAEACTELANTAMEEGFDERDSTEVLTAAWEHHRAGTQPDVEELSRWRTALEAYRDRQTRHVQRLEAVTPPEDPEHIAHWQVYLDQAGQQAELAEQRVTALDAEDPVQGLFETANPFIGSAGTSTPAAVDVSVDDALKDLDLEWSDCAGLGSAHSLTEMLGSEMPARYPSLVASAAQLCNGLALAQREDPYRTDADVILRGTLTASDNADEAPPVDELQDSLKRRISFWEEAGSGFEALTTHAPEEWREAVLEPIAEEVSFQQRRLETADAPDSQEYREVFAPGSASPRLLDWGVVGLQFRSCRGVTI